MAEPCKNCGRPDCPTLTMPELTSDAAWMVRYRARNDCVDHTVNWRDRALAAEKQLATLQQTVDAIVRERDALRGKVERLKQIAQTARNAKLSRFETGPVSTAKVRAAHKLSDKFLAVLNDKETK